MLQVNQPYLNLMKLKSELCSGKHKQQTGHTGNWQNPSVPTCFAGVAFRVAGRKLISGQEWEDFYGLTGLQVTDLVVKNDRGMPFPELASLL